MRTDKNRAVAAGQVMTSTPDLLTRKQVAAHLDCCHSTVKRLEEKGRLKARTPPGAKPQLFARTDVETLAAELRGEDPDAAAERKARGDVVALALAHAQKVQDQAAKSSADREAAVERFAGLVAGLLTTATASNAQLAAAVEAANAKALEAMGAWRAMYLADAERDAKATKAAANRDIAREAMQAFKPIVPTIGSLLARQAHLPVTEQRHQADVVAEAMSSISPEAQAAVLAALDEDQRDAVESLLAAAAVNKQAPAMLAHLATTLTHEQMGTIAQHLGSEGVASLQTILANVAKDATKAPEASARSAA